MAFQDYIPVYGDTPQLVGGLEDTFGKNKTLKRRLSGAVRAGAAGYGIGSSIAGALAGAGTGASIGAAGGPIGVAVGVPVGALVGAFTGGGLGKLGAKAGINSAKFIAKYGTKKAMNKTAQQAAIRNGANPLITKANAALQNMPYNMSVGLKRFNDYVAKNPISLHPYLAYLGAKSPQAIHDILSYSFSGDGSSRRDVTKKDGDSGTQTNGYAGSGGGYGYGGTISSGLSPEQQATLMQQLAQGYGGMSPGYDYGEEGRQMVRDYMMKQQAMQPYRENLQNYIRDYQNRSDLAYNQDRELAALTGLTGNSAYANMMGKNNALTSEAARVGLMKDYGEDLKSVGEGMDTLVGNMALAQITGLPLSAANADSKMAQLAVNKMIADNRNENRLAVEQYKGQMRLQYAQLQARLKAQLRANDRVGAANTYKQLNAFSKALKLANDYGLTADDIYRNTGARFNIPENVGQVGDVKI